MFTAYSLQLTVYSLQFNRYLQLEVDVETIEPVGLELKRSRRAAGSEDGPSEGSLTVALERDVVDGLGDEHIVVGIEGLDGDGHRLLVGVEEREAGDLDGGACRCGRVVDLRKPIVGESEPGRGIEALATFLVGGADLGCRSRTSIGGDDPQA